jgi:hypothetical protein
MLGDSSGTLFVLVGVILDHEILNNGAEVHGNKLTVKLHSQDVITKATALTDDKTSCIAFYA